MVEQAVAKQEVTRLNLLVHPHFIPDVRFNVRPVSQLTPFIAERRKFHTAAVAKLAPRTAHEVTVLMPAMNTHSLLEWRGELETIRRAREACPQLAQWPDLYRDLKQRAAFPPNVRIARDLLNDPQAESDFAQSLEPINHRITAETQVFVGGEWLGLCLFSTVYDLLTKTELGRLVICGGISTSAESWVNNSEFSRESDLGRIMKMSQILLPNIKVFRKGTNVHFVK